MNRMSKTRVLALLALLSGWSLQAAEITLQTPKGGWRGGVAEGDNSYLQEVHYPANAVNSAPEQGKESLIKGDIKRAPKTQSNAPTSAASATTAPKPYTLIVNGLAMPQRIEEDGSFSRPYAFAAGSNSVELRSADGKERKRVQFYDQKSGMQRPKLRILLSWDSDNTDLDLHVLTPGGEHLFYGNRVLENGSALDVDVTTGYGPEIFSAPAPEPGVYLVYVNYFGSGEEENSIMTTAQVTIITEEGSVDEQRQSFLIPLRNPGELTLAQRFILP